MFFTNSIWQNEELPFDATNIPATMEDFLNAWVEITEAMKELWLFGRPLATDVACCNYAKPAWL